MHWWLRAYAVLVNNKNVSPSFTLQKTTIKVKLDNESLYTIIWNDFIQKKIVSESESNPTPNIWRAANQQSNSLDFVCDFFVIHIVCYFNCIMSRFEKTKFITQRQIYDKMSTKAAKYVNAHR